MISPMLCKDDLDGFMKKTDPLNTWASLKLDGVRTLTDTIQFWSRSGKSFPNFDVLRKDLLVLKGYIEKTHGFSPVFDGEVCADGFSKLMTQLRRIKDIDPSIFRYRIFDIANFDGASFEERYHILEEAQRAVGRLRTVSVLSHMPGLYRTKECVLDALRQAVESGYEGLVLKDGKSLYVPRKSSAWCKVKQFETLDVDVMATIEGKGKHKGKLGALICAWSYQGSTVTFKVGTGFSDKEREEFWKNPPSLVEVKYQEITKHGRPRFPSYVRVRDDK